MHIVKEEDSIDAIAAPMDNIEVEVDNRTTGRVLYVHVNGRTILRIGHIKDDVVLRLPEK